MQVIAAAATEAALPFDRLVPALASLFVTGAEQPPRQVLTINAPDGGAMTSLVMPAWAPGRAYGVKVINIAPGNAARGLPGLHASYLLHDAVTGVPLALIDGDVLTARRTAAVAALAARELARPDAQRLLVLGAGRIAALLPAAYAAVRTIAHVDVWARRPDQASALAAALRRQGFNAHAAPDLATATMRAHIVACATLATAPLLQGEWLAAGSHVDLIGSFTPAMREADDRCLAQADLLFIDSEDALQKSGELLAPLASGAITPGQVRGTLAQLLRGERAGRGHPSERSVFKSVGSALQDLAAAMLVCPAPRAT
ncbi:putative ornithine cyclodeaminase, mu-crystallin [Burkholderiales bacterium JOSHI_001]|nr:putative ornithine cyclodeaminase, mu-crystallin [Burkholderiales bacterium JOSHI_001]